MGKLAAIIATAAVTVTLTAIPASAEPVVVYQLAGSHRCLADTGSNVVLKLCNELSGEQRWIVPISGGVDWPRNIATGKCLAATASGDVLGQACTTSGKQRWRRVASGTSFQFRNVGTNKCLTAQVTVATCTTSSAKWNGLR
ncbi:Cytolethal distending toxin A/C domain-containing protein [Lentzea albidocapillata subsp. violacea]|uniref:Cytolethal distending toxin A/C domain-containing protein n=1 Tax=Lentzea albidocapillata subsp. violacea TaxID=128104 RepID=A0A1G9QGB3_9PSEU|nr:ricin-type beta-trefoil lectin domain protein [Lentzea albidocapillata]SDM09920.1 Cytolethal distending toxin A/C domain-containing protein [Lentzea albidocapillata subsp. violacea]